MKKYNPITELWEPYQTDYAECLAFDKLRKARIPCKFTKHGIIIENKDEAKAVEALQSELD